jgi:hypothetical protein
MSSSSRTITSLGEDEVVGRVLVGLVTGLGYISTMCPSPPLVPTTLDSVTHFTTCDVSLIGTPTKLLGDVLDTTMKPNTCLSTRDNKWCHTHSSLFFSRTPSHTPTFKALLPKHRVSQEAGVWHCREGSRGPRHQGCRSPGLSFYYSSFLYLSCILWMDRKATTKIREVI